MNYNYINFDYLDDIFGAEVGIKKKYIITYLAASENNWTMIEDLISKTDGSSLKMKLHQMKPTYITFGSAESAELCFEIEQKLVFPQIPWTYISNKIDTLKMLDTFMNLELNYWLSQN